MFSKGKAKRDPLMALEKRQGKSNPCEIRPEHSLYQKPTFQRKRLYQSHVHLKVHFKDYILYSPLALHCHLKGRKAKKHLRKSHSLGHRPK